jgi:hypothetical protein
MDKYGNDPRNRDPKPVERRLIPVYIDGGLLVVTDWQGRERRFASHVQGLQHAASLYRHKRAQLAEANQPDDKPANWGRPLHPIVWHSQRAKYSNGRAKRL